MAGRVKNTIKTGAKVAGASLFHNFVGNLLSGSQKRKAAETGAAVVKGAEAAKGGASSEVAATAGSEGYGDAFLGFLKEKFHWMTKEDEDRWLMLLSRLGMIYEKDDELLEKTSELVESMGFDWDSFRRRAINWDDDTVKRVLFRFDNLRQKLDAIQADDAIVDKEAALEETMEQAAKRLTLMKALEKKGIWTRIRDHWFVTLLILLNIVF